LAGIHANFILENNLIFLVTTPEYFKVIIEEIFINNNLLSTLEMKIIYVTTSTYYGPHMFPKFLSNPVRIYPPNLNRNLIGVENRNRTVIYQ
jgi:hypothetical protein